MIMIDILNWMPRETNNSNLIFLQLFRNAQTIYDYDRLVQTLFVVSVRKVRKQSFDVFVFMLNI